ncbi:MAG: RNA 2',3'-cyclic phosphodiesterase [Chloroflexi bacterium]|nr:RNA 2',3'-cyclic phosphodiesterase [Chloroflexota bacterium]
MELVRSFIAIELPAEVRAELASIEEKLKVRRHSFVKWADPESIHLTLKFLGSVSGETIPEIVEAMSLVAQPVCPFTLQIGGTGAFPNWQRPQIVWVGVGGEMGRLATLQRELEAALSPLSFPPESRPFSPHLTLGRLRERVTPEDRRRFGLWAQSVKFEASLSFEVNAVRLMKSQLTSSGPIYSELALVKLKARD